MGHSYVWGSWSLLGALVKHIFGELQKILGHSCMGVLVNGFGANWPALQLSSYDFMCFDIEIKRILLRKLLSIFRNFLSMRCLEKQISWKLCHQELSMQTDGYNCGVFSTLVRDLFSCKVIDSYIIQHFLL